jgi:hypothetical protein
MIRFATRLKPGGISKWPKRSGKVWTVASDVIGRIDEKRGRKHHK